MHVIFNLFLLVFFSYLFSYLACVTVEVCVDQNEQESFKKQLFLGTTKTTNNKVQMHSSTTIKMYPTYQTSKITL